MIYKKKKKSKKILSSVSLIWGADSYRNAMRQLILREQIWGMPAASAPPSECLIGKVVRAGRAI